MTVSLHVAPHPDVLVAALCERLRTSPPDPFTAEVIAVPTRGIERWLTQRIALELSDVAGGIAANIEFPSPAEVVRGVVLQYPELAASIESWDGPVLLRTVMAAIDDTLAEPPMALLRRHLAAVGTSRMAAASKVTRLFTTYARRRPAMVAAWAEGADMGPDGHPIEERHRWQPRLWREVRSRLGVPALPELGERALEQIRAGIPDFTERLSVYGMTATDPFDLDVLVAIGATRDVHLHVLHPSPGLWLDPDRVRHPLLGSWGRNAAELQQVLVAHGIGGRPVGVADDTTSLLGAVQSDIRANRPPTDAAPDRSVQIHVCHGDRRQVEVLRDAVLHLLASDPTLEPRDVVVMTPDLATFAPLLEAAFPAETDGQLPDLRVRIADRSPAATNPLVRFTAAVLDLVDGRLEAGVVRNLVAVPVVQERFRFDADTAAEIVRLIDDASVAWGLDLPDREAWGLGEVADRTWRRGLDRALAGVFYTDSPVRVVDGVAPLDGVEGQEARPAGILAAIVDRLAAIRARLSEPMPMSEWPAAVMGAVRMLAAVGWDDEWQWTRLERLLAGTFPVADGAPDPDVSLVEARRAMTAWTDDRPSPLHFRSGDVTVCTLVPMRSVPYRVVCLLGMDDDRFPRRGRSDGDDLLADHRVVGDHDRSAEDRQLLLDAVMAAGDHLIVTYSGRDAVTNAEYPPAVPIAELTEVLTTMTGREERDLVTEHPLQSFSETVFTPGELGVDGPWGFDRTQWAGALAIRQRTAAAPPEAWPPIDPPEVIRLEDLSRFLTHPVAGFVRASLGFRIPDPPEIVDDQLRVDVPPLEVWQIRDEMLAGVTVGHDLDALVARARGADAFPPGALAASTIDRSRQLVEELWRAAEERGYHKGRHRRYRGEPKVTGRLVEGTVVADPGSAHLPIVTPSRVKAKQRLRAYAELVFLTLLEPGPEWHAMLLGRRSRGSGLVEVTIGPLAATPADRADEARRRLADLVALYDEGHRRPMPLPCDTAHAWQSKLPNRKAAEAYAREPFQDDRYSGDADDPAHRLVFPELTTVDDLLGTSFEDDCRRLWEPILAVTRERRL